MNRTKRAIKIIISNIVLQVVNIICGLILPPLMIKEFGSEVNGLVTTIRQIVTYFSIVSLGLGLSCQVALYEPLEKKEYIKINSILSATKIFFDKAGYMFSGLILGFSFVLPFMVTSKIPFNVISSIVLICGMGSVCEFIITTKYKVLLSADQKQDVVNNIWMKGTIMNTILSCILIVFHYNVVLVQISATIAQFIRLFLLKRYIKRNYPYINVKAKPNFDAIASRWTAFNYQVAKMINGYTPPVLVAIFCGFINASIYSVYDLVFAALIMITNIFSSGLSASFGNIFVRKEKSKLIECFNIYIYLYNIIIYTIYSCALVLVIPFVSIYIKSLDGINYILPTLAVTFGINGISKAIRTPYVTIVEAEGEFKKNGKYNLIEAISNIVLSIVLVKRYGMIGILTAGTITGGIRSVIYILYVNKSVVKFNIKKIFLEFIVNIGLIFIMYNILIVQINSYLEWILEAIKCSIICIVAFIIINSLINIKAAKDLKSRVWSMCKYR